MLLVHLLCGCVFAVYQQKGGGGHRTGVKSVLYVYGNTTPAEYIKSSKTVTLNLIEECAIKPED